MIVKIKKVYYCEHCKKHSLLPLVEHEKHCTHNPNRECRLCEEKTNILAIAEKIPFIGDIALNGWDIKEINKYTHCPNCILAIIHQLQKNGGKHNVEGFDYKEELKQWLQIDN